MILSDVRTLIGSDIETTGFRPESACVTEFSAVAVVNDEIVHRISFLLKPRDEHDRVPPNITEITGISDEMRETQGIPYEEGMRHIATLLTADNTPLVFQNGLTFDIPFLNHHLQAHGHPSINPNRLLDTAYIWKGMQLGNPIYVDTNWYAYAQAAQKRRSTAKFNLDLMAEYFGIPKAENRHRALDDVELMLGCFFRMRKQATMSMTQRRGDRLPAVPFNHLRTAVATCKRCAISTCSKNRVFGAGGLYAPILFVGEAPGEQEDAAGTPFVEAAPAGGALRELIREAGITEGQFYIDNLVRCRPPEGFNPETHEPYGVRKPTPEEIEACKGYLIDAIWNLEPKVIVTLGHTATVGLLNLDPKLKMSEIRNMANLSFESRGRRIPVFPEYHPSYLVRQGKPPQLWATMRGRFRLAARAAGVRK